LLARYLPCDVQLHRWGRVLFHFSTTCPKGLKAGAAIAALAAPMVLAGAPAQAAEIFLKTAEMVTPGTATIKGPGPSTPGYPTINVTAYDAPVIFTAYKGTSATGTAYTVVGFCVDIFHEISVGVNTPKTINLKYHTGLLGVDGDGHTLSAPQDQEIAGLITLGTQLYRLNSPDLANKLAGIQGAIWSIENPLYSVTGGTAAIKNYISSYIAMAPTLTGAVEVLYSDSGTTQAFGVVGVPEPGVWAMLIAGIGVIGARLRTARSRKALAAA